MYSSSSYLKHLHPAFRGECSTKMISYNYKQKNNLKLKTNNRGRGEKHTSFFSSLTLAHIFLKRKEKKNLKPS